MSKKQDNSITGIRSIQNTSCHWTGTGDFGRLIPIHWKELVPSEKITHFQPKIELQLLSLAAPTFGQLDMYLHTFFVPTRIIWKDSQDFFSRQGPNANAIPPYWTLSQLATWYNASSSGDKRAFFKHWTSLGLPPFFTESSYRAAGAPNDDRRSLLPFRAYNRIWWDFYRDPEVLRDSSLSQYVSDSSGIFDPNSGDGKAIEPKIRTLKDNWIANLYAQGGQTPASMYAGLNSDANAPYPVRTGSDASQRLRQIEALTRLSERLSLGGKRQIDAMFAAYGVKPDFMKMQMAQYLGGTKETIAVDDIISTADTSLSGYDDDDNRYNTGSPLGAKSGAGYCRLFDFDVQFTAPESGYFVCMLSIMPHIHFVQGFNKMWTRNQLSDFFTKQLEHVGLVAVAKNEVGALGLNSPSYDRTKDLNTFAFTQPYYEYKMGQDILAGDLMKYHNDTTVDPYGDLKKDIAFMQALEMFQDYPENRNFNYDNLLVDGPAFNKIFYYLGGSTFSDVDDHFMIDCHKTIIKDSPMDGFAVPSLETTQDPHKAQQPIGSDTVL